MSAVRSSDRLARFDRRLVQWLFAALIDPIEVSFVSEGDAHQPASQSIELKLPSLLRTLELLLKPDLKLGQYYVDEHWSVQPERLFDFLYLIRSQESSHLQHWFLLSTRAHLVRDALKQRIFPIRSTRAVVEHYNTDPIFMSLVLGQSLSYTCAFFDEAHTSLDEAQKNKLSIVTQRASIQARHSVLDLGTGWGYAPFPLAEQLGCHVTGITLSEVQARHCNERRENSIAKERLSFLCADYATYAPAKKFDRVISLGMLEHVGKHQYGFFFDQVANFLEPNGIALIHSMVEERATSPDAWIDRNIFPGGYIPTTSEVVSAIESSLCELTSLLIHEKSNYFRTLDAWKTNLFNNRTKCENRLASLGLKRAEIIKVLRVWEYFLSSSQIAFSERHGRCRIAHFLVRRKTP